MRHDKLPLSRRLGSYQMCGHGPGSPTSWPGRREGGLLLVLGAQMHSRSLCRFAEARWIPCPVPKNVLCSEAWRNDETQRMRSPSHCLVACFRGLTISLLAACGGKDGDVCSPTLGRPLAVLSAFPAEMGAVLAHAREVREVAHGRRRVRLAQIGKHPVVVGMTGIGLVNARQAAGEIVNQFAISGVLLAGVAGSSSVPIGNVVVPQRWRLRSGEDFSVHPAWWRIVQELALRGELALARCTTVRMLDGPRSVCMPGLPQLLSAELGLSDDPFAGQPFPCEEGGDDLYGCDLPGNDLAATLTKTVAHPRRANRRAEDRPAITDMETAAMAQVASEQGLPFLAFRAVSDGPGDPLQLPNFLEQFSTYYRYAATNAALAVEAFLQTLPCGR